jgi:DNA (cytosine-5)-methyltransferase 1
LLDVPRRLLTDHLRRLVDGAYGSGGHVKNIYGRLEWGKPSGTVVAGIDKITCGRFVHPVENRLLTPRECARLQSFPDEFAFMPSLVASYYLIGNAVPPKAAAAMGRSVASFLDQNGSTASRKTIKSAR